MAKKQKLWVTGFTVDGLPTAGGIFEMTDTHGMPLDVVLEACKENKVIVCWRTYFEATDKAGWNRDRTKLRASEAISDVFGSEYRDQWEKSLEKYFNGLEEGPEGTI